MKSRYLVIRDEHSKLFGRRFLNSQLSLYLGSVQLLVCLWALAQHFWSMLAVNKILHCDFTANSTLPPLLTHVDAIIFDIGLFHHLWGISGCVAQHLDGGYGRFLWCIVHSLALLFCLPFAFVTRPKPYWLWPLLIQQSAYGVGMLILSLAALPKAAHLLGDLSNAPLRAIAFYLFGTMMNFFLLYVYWHWYWHVEALWSSARKLRRGESFAASTRRPIRHWSPAVEKQRERDRMAHANGTMAHQNGGTAPLFAVHQNGGIAITTTATLALKNGHGPPKPSRKMLNVTIATSTHPTAHHNGAGWSAKNGGGTTTALLVGPRAMPVARIEEEAEEEEEDVLHEHSARMPNGHQATAQRCNGTAGGGRHRRHSRGSSHSASSATAASTATTTTLNAAQQQQHQLETTAQAATATSRTQTAQQPVPKQPPPPAPSPSSGVHNAPAPALLAEQQLPPRVRHLRREEGGTRAALQPQPQQSKHSLNSSVCSASTSGASNNSAGSPTPRGRRRSATLDACPGGTIAPVGTSQVLLHSDGKRRSSKRLSIRQRNRMMAAARWRLADQGSSLDSALPPPVCANAAAAAQPARASLPSSRRPPPPSVQQWQLHWPTPNSSSWTPQPQQQPQQPCWSSTRAERVASAPVVYASTSGAPASNGIAAGGAAPSRWTTPASTAPKRRALDGPLSSLPLAMGNGGGTAGAHKYSEWTQQTAMPMATNGSGGSPATTTLSRVGGGHRIVYPVGQQQRLAAAPDFGRLHHFGQTPLEELV